MEKSLGNIYRRGSVGVAASYAVQAFFHSFPWAIFFDCENHVFGARGIKDTGLFLTHNTPLHPDTLFSGKERLINTNTEYKER